VAKKIATAIDISTDSVKVIQLKNTSTGIKIVNWGMGRYPRPDVGAKVSDETIVSTLRQVLSEAKINPKSLATSIPRALVTQKKVNIHTQTSTLTEEDINEVVALQAEVEIPFGASNAIYSHHNVQKSPEGMSAELVAARKETITRYMDIFKAADLQVDAMLPSTYAISAVALNQLVSNNAAEVVSERNENTIMVIDIGAEYTDLCILCSNRTVFSRSFPIGGNLLTQIYAQEQGLLFEEAEEYKSSNASLSGDAPQAAPTYEWSERLARELQLSIKAFGHDMLGAETIDSIWMCGCGATISGLDQYLTDRLKIKTKLWNPLTEFESNLPEMKTLNSQKESSGNLKYSFAVSLGLALNTFTNQITVNLLPIEEVQRKQKARRRIVTLSCAAAALILIVGISLGVNSWISSRNAQFEETSAKLQAVRKPSNQTKSILIDDLVMTKMLSPRISPLDVLQELSAKFPDRTQIALTNFTLDRNQKVILNVESNSHAEISNLISTLGKSGLFVEVKSRQISTTEKQKDKPILQAQVTCKLANNALKYLEDSAEQFVRRSNTDLGEARDWKTASADEEKPFGRIERGKKSE